MTAMLGPCGTVTYVSPVVWSVATEIGPSFTVTVTVAQLVAAGVPVLLSVSSTE